jgi:hypothetical protein
MKAISANASCHAPKLRLDASLLGKPSQSDGGVSKLAVDDGHHTEHHSEYCPPVA